VERSTIAKEIQVAPIFRWAGSKRKLVNRLLANVPEDFKCYVEPFAGSACLFFALKPQFAVLGDFNESLIEAYQVVARSPKRVHDAAARMPNTKNYYYHLRSTAPLTLSPLQRAARFLYLNRYCFNGVYRTNRSGKFNVPRGRDTGTLPDLQAMRRCSKALKGAELVAGDFRTTLAKVQAGDFVYLDPPYAKIDDRYSGEYGYGAFSSKDLEALHHELNAIDQKGASFLLSYRYSKRLRFDLDKWHTSVISVRRHVAGFSSHRGVVREFLVSNRAIKKAQ